MAEVQGSKRALPAQADQEPEGVTLNTVPVYQLFSRKSGMACQVCRKADNQLLD